MRISRPTLIIGIAFILAGLLLWWMYEANITPVVTIPPRPPLPSPNAADYFANAPIASARNLVVDPTAPLAAREATVAANAAMFATMREGLAYPHVCPPDYRIMGVSRRAKIFRVEASVRAEHGDIPGAVTSHLDNIHFGIIFPKGGGPTPYLIGIECEGIGQMDLWTLVNRCDAATAKAAVARLEGLQAQRVSYAEALTNEKYASQQLLLDSFNDPAAQEWGSYALATMGGKRKIMAEWTRYHDDQIAEARKPYWQQQPVRLPSNLKNETFGIPNIIGARFRATKVETQTALLTIAFALRAYHLEHKAYPATLAELMPGYLASVPNDPFSGKPLQYTRTGKTYLLYSAGPDGKDDGGTPCATGQAATPTAYVTGGNNNMLWHTSTGDIVAGVNRY